MNPRASIRPAAREDLYEQFLYLADRDRQIAWQFLQAVEATVDTLVDSPDLGIRYESARGRFRDLRVWKANRFKNHLIFYRPTNEGVEIVRIVHGARDYDALLGADE